MSEQKNTFIAPDLTAVQFRKIRELLYTDCRIVLNPGKETLVKSRLMVRMNALGLHSFDQYLKLVKASASELPVMIDALTTNKTSFFREAQHFDYVRRVLIPILRESNQGASIWSAGCSSGEEPYSLAMLLHSELGESHSRGVRILATDISTSVLETGRAGIYGQAAIREIPSVLLQTYFERIQNGSERMHQVRPFLKEMVRFARLNLMRPWPMTGLFDMIFCRNVMIYFDKPTQQQLVSRLVARLRPGGHLFVGHSESVMTADRELSYVQPAVYLKQDEAAPRKRFRKRQAAFDLPVGGACL